jgi:hypothetical protein
LNIDYKLICSTGSSENNRTLFASSLMMVSLFDLRVVLSTAETYNKLKSYYVKYKKFIKNSLKIHYILHTFKMLRPSISKVISICGVPLGAGGIPVSLKYPRK